MTLSLFSQMFVATLLFVALGVSVKTLGQSDMSLACVTFARFLVSLIVYLPA